MDSFWSSKIYKLILKLATSLITLSSCKDQASRRISAAAIEVFLPLRKRCRGAVFVNNSTPAHFIRAENTTFSVFDELFKELPAKSRFTGSGCCADYVKSRTKKLMIFNIFEGGLALSVVFQIVNIRFKMIGEVISLFKAFGRLCLPSLVTLILNVNKHGSYWLFELWIGCEF